MFKRIMFATPTLASGGAEKVASIFANNLIKMNKDIYFFTLYPVDEEYNLDNKINRICLVKSKKEYDNLNFIQKIVKIRLILKEVNPEIVIPFVTYIGIFFTLSKFFLNIKIIETVRNNPTKISFKLLLLRNLSINKADGCIFQNSNQENYFSRNKNNLLLSNPIEEKFLECKKVYKSIPKKIITFGRLTDQKNHKLLIDAVELLINESIDIVLEIYGDGELKQDIIKYICDRKLEKYIKIYDRTPEVLEKLKSSDIFVLSSKYEGMPNALLEAMAVGVPCISTNCPTGPSDIITNNVNGILIDNNNVNELYIKIKYFINNYETAIEYGKQAKKDMYKFSEKNITIQLRNYIDSLGE